MNDIIALVHLNKNYFELFQGLPQEEIEAIVKSADKKFIPAKTIFIEQDSLSDTAYLILKGSVNVYRMNENGEETNICVLGEGDIVGEMALIDHEARSAFVAAITDTTALILTGKSFKMILQRYPDVAIHLLSSLSKRIRKSDKHTEELLTKTLLTRTWNTLQILKRYYPNNVVHLSHEELASIIGATRARTTEALNELEKAGKIELSHRSIKIC